MEKYYMTTATRTFAMIPWHALYSERVRKYDAVDALHRCLPRARQISKKAGCDRVAIMVSWRHEEELQDFVPKKGEEFTLLVGSGGVNVPPHTFGVVIEERRDDETKGDCHQTNLY